MSNQNALGIEQARIITISTAHLSPFSREYISDRNGNIDNGPSIAVRDEGFLANSYLNGNNELERAFTPVAGVKPLIERVPDLVLVQALARGLGAEWISFDADAVEYTDILPSYDDDGEITIPTGDGWREALGTVGTNYWDSPVVMPTREVLEIIEAGQTPGLDFEGSPEP